MVAGTGGGGEPMISVAPLFRVPTVAVIVTVALTAFAVKVSVATPETLVATVPPKRKLPAVTSLTVNVTFTPLMTTPAASLTVADTAVLPDETIVAEPRVMIIEVGTWGGVPMVMEALSLIVAVPTVTLTLMVAVVSAVVAVNRLVAIPDAFVTAEEGVSVPAVALITEKVTPTFGITTELASVTIAVTVEVPPLAMAAAERDTWTVVGVGVVGAGVPVPGAPVTGPLKSVPQLPRKITKNRTLGIFRVCLILSLPNCWNDRSEISISNGLLIEASTGMSVRDDRGSIPHRHRIKCSQL
jgi:hypothetical protein